MRVQLAAALPPASSEDTVDRLRRLIEWLAPAAWRMGLTNYPDAETLATQLVLPALALLQPPLATCLRGPVLDFGAGSGAIGLALAVARPDLEIVLADRRSRVVQFVDLCIARFGLHNCASLQADLMAGPTSEARYGLVLLRAFGPTESALTAAEQWLSVEGAVALWHQPPPAASPGLRPALSLPTSVPSLELTIYTRPES